MENVTHSLIGVTLGEAVALAFSRRQRPAGVGTDAALESAGLQSLRRGVLWAAVLGSNLPDFDFLMRPFVGSGLGYLLHHRGYTHTVLFSFPLALIAAGVGRWASRRSGKGVSAAPAPWSVLWLAGWLGVLCHVGADFWNDYGVHPFWPHYNEWIYGDLIFILEPLFWLSLLPFAYFGARSWVAHVTCGVLALGVLAAAWSGKFMQWQVALWLTFWAVAWSALFASVRVQPDARRDRRARAVVYAFAAILGVLTSFGAGSAKVRDTVRSLVPPGEELLRISSTPAPGNPLCWRVITSSRVRGPALQVGAADYVARVGVLTLGPHDWAPTDPTRCQPRVPMPRESDSWDGEVLSPMGPEAAPWTAEFRGKTGELQKAMADHCRIGAGLIFMRMPYWRILPDGSVIVGDLRYHWGKGLGFADLVSLPGESCFSPEPPWGRPSGL